MPNLSLLNTALNMHGGRLVPMLHKLAKESKITCPTGSGFSDYTIQQFVKDWSNGGKNFCEGKWRTSAFSVTRPRVPGNSEFYATFNDDDEEEEPELFHGEHEWIPTNMLAYVVEHGLLQHGNLKWLYLADTLRTPTASVVLHPKYAHYPVSTSDPFGLTGHVEAIFIRQGATYTARFKAQQAFHDDLRKILKTNLNKNMDKPSSFVTALQQYIASTFWQGDLPSIAAEYKMSTSAFSAAPCPYYFKEASGVCGSWGATMGDMATRLREQWLGYNQILKNVGDTLPYA